MVYLEVWHGFELEVTTPAPWLWLGGGEVLYCSFGYDRPKKDMRKMVAGPFAYVGHVL